MSDAPASRTAGPVIVLGAGIAGLSAADTLVKAGQKVIVVERRDSAGGIHRSRQIGPYTFDVGSIFYEEDARIFDLAPSLRDACPEVLSIQRRIAPDGAIRLYPIEPRDFLRQPSWRLAGSVLDLLVSRVATARDGTLDAVCRKRLGRRFFEDTGLRSYISRFHHVPPELIDEEFFFRRMAIIERFTRLETLVRSAARTLFTRDAETSGKQWPMRIRPREGFAALFTPIVDRLSAAGVEFAFGEQLAAVEREGSFFRVRTNRAVRLSSAVVSTVPADTLHRALFAEPSGLVSLDMTTLYLSADWLHPETGNVLFNFHERGGWKRATIYSRLYTEPASARAFFAVEITLPPGSRHAPEAAFEAFREHAAELGLARGLKLEGHDLVEDCYPLYRIGTQATADAVLDRISQTGVISAGRQGRFEYLPTSSGVIAQVARHLAPAFAPGKAPELAA